LKKGREVGEKEFWEGGGEKTVAALHVTNGGAQKQGETYRGWVGAKEQRSRANVAFQYASS